MWPVVAPGLRAVPRQYAWEVSRVDLVSDRTPESEVGASMSIATPVDVCSYLAQQNDLHRHSRLPGATSPQRQSYRSGQGNTESS